MIISKEQYWTIYLNPKQNFIGRCKIVNNLKKENLGQLTDKEWIELGRIEKQKNIFKIEEVNKIYNMLKCARMEMK